MQVYPTRVIENVITFKFQLNNAFKQNGTTCIIKPSATMQSRMYVYR